MKLLDRKTVNVELARQRKQQIDEGVTIATKIDVLRQTLGSLEAQHKTFLTGMQSELQRATEGLSDGIAAKKKELIVLEEKRQQLLIPLDVARKEIETKLIEVSNLKSLADKKLAQTLRNEQKAEENNKTAKDILGRIKIRERELSKAYNDADRIREETQDMHNKMLAKKKSQDEYYEKTEIELTNRIARIEFDTQANENYKKLLESREQDIIIQERINADQRATLERALKRLNT